MPESSSRPLPTATAGRGTAVSVRGVTKRFGETLALDAVDLEISAGEFVALLGPSGGGKTTLMRIVAGLERQDAGRVLFGGRDVSAVPARRRDANTVFQDYALFPHLTVRANIAYGPRVHGRPRAERDETVGRLLDLVRLGPVADRYPAQRAGGQRQRVALARALANTPSVLLLDEPLAALDRKLRQDVQGELRRIHERLGTTFMFVTHDQEEAFALADRVAVLHDGRIEQEGTPSRLYDDPATAWVAGFVGRQNRVRARVVAFDAGGAAVEPDGGADDAGGAGARWESHSVHPGVHAGAEVWAMVRPERLRWTDTGRVEATVTRVIDLGADAEVVARDAAGRDWEVRWSRGTQRALPAVGARGALDWDAVDLHLYPAAEDDGGRTA
ncbi:MAG: ABC transporter ATP-binding protein [Pseudoclavibacter sp.]